MTKDWLLGVGESHFEIWQAYGPSFGQARTQSWVLTEEKVVKRHQPLMSGSCVTLGIRTAVASTLKRSFHYRPHDLQGLAICGLQGSELRPGLAEGEGLRLRGPWPGRRGCFLLSFKVGFAVFSPE